ncbi:hypothetical protein [Vampirovibrio sp.]|uniref:hypothetical protein n=1 Tax=Vampirovibrio sp. TaxID=2717857 RepID=UPI003593E490
MRILVEKQTSEIEFKAGDSNLEIFEKLLEHQKYKLLFKIRLSLTETEAETLRQKGTGVIF